MYTYIEIYIYIWIYVYFPDGCLHQGDAFNSDFFRRSQDLECANHFVAEEASTKPVEGLQVDRDLLLCSLGTLAEWQTSDKWQESVSGPGSGFPHQVVGKTWEGQEVV